MEVAIEAHKGQQRLDGRPYILHPIRMVARATSSREQVVCLLHDVVEDSDLTISDLAELGFDEKICLAVEAISHSRTDSYDEYINRLCTNDIARRVKILDLQDNLDYREWPNTSSYFEKMRDYFNAIKKLEGMG